MPGGGGGGSFGGGGGCRSSGGFYSRSRVKSSNTPKTPRQKAEETACCGFVVGLLGIAAVIVLQVLIMPVQFNRVFELNVGEQRVVPFSNEVDRAEVRDTCNGCTGLFVSKNAPKTPDYYEEDLEAKMGKKNKNGEVELEETDDTMFVPKWTRHWKSPSFDLGGDVYQYWYFHVGRGSSISVDVQKGHPWIAFMPGNWTFPGDSPSPDAVRYTDWHKEPESVRYTFDSADWGTVVVMAFTGKMDLDRRSSRLRVTVDYRLAPLALEPPSEKALVETDKRRVAKPSDARGQWYTTIWVPRWHPELKSGCINGCDTVTVTIPSPQYWQYVAGTLLECFVVASLIQRLWRRYRRRMDEIKVQFRTA